MIHVLELQHTHAHVYKTTSNGTIIRRACSLTVPCSCNAPLQDVGARFAAPTASSWSAAKDYRKYDTIEEVPYAHQLTLRQAWNVEALA